LSSREDGGNSTTLQRVFVPRESPAFFYLSVQPSSVPSALAAQGVVQQL
jgi:hypothetical protein